MGNPQLAIAMKKHIEVLNYKVIDIVTDVESLFQSLEHNQVFGIFLTTDLARKLNDKRLEFLADSVFTLRERYPNVQLLVLSNEEIGHPFLKELVQMGLYNVFLKGQGNLNVQQLLVLLSQPKTFGDVSHLLNVDPSIPWRITSTTPNRIIINSQEKAETVNSSTKDEGPDIEKKTEKKQRSEKLTRTKEKVVKERIIEKVEVRKEIVRVDSNLVFVCNLSPKAGSTFITANLARYLAQNNVPVTVTESPNNKPYYYHFLGMINQEEPIYSVVHEILNGNDMVSATKLPLIKGVKWNVLFPSDLVNKVDEQRLLKILFSSHQSGTTLMDLGSNLEHTSVLNYAQQVIVAIDPNPMEIINNIHILKRFMKLKEEGKNIYFVINKWTEPLKRKEFREKMNLEPDGYIPYIEPMLVYDALYNNKFPIDYREVDSELSEGLAAIANKVTNLSFEKSKKRPFNLFSR